MVDALQALPKKEEPKRATIKSVITLEEMMARLETRINQNLRVNFFELHGQEPERKTIIVGFLAILELFKQGNVLVNQGSRFADIEIERDIAGTPKYY